MCVGSALVRTPLTILLSPKMRDELAAKIASTLGAQSASLVTVDEQIALERNAVDIAFISRDVTGLATKHELTPEVLAFHTVLRRSNALQWVHIHSTGADRAIYPELRARGVTVTTSPGANAEVVAQTALAGLLALARKFPQMMAAQQARTWASLATALPRDLAGQTALIVGWGRIGQRIGALLRFLGLHVIVARHSGQPVEQDGIETVALSRLHHALPRADWLLLACPLSDTTRALIDARAFAALPRGAHFINVARGEVVVQHHLIAALQSGHLGGAYLDVFEHEPLGADSPLWHLPHVIVTPHSAGLSDGYPRRVAEMFLTNLARWQQAQALLHAIA